MPAGTVDGRLHLLGLLGADVAGEVLDGHVGHDVAHPGDAMRLVTDRFRKRRDYFEDTRFPIRINTDHKALTQQLNRDRSNRLINRWDEIMGDSIVSWRRAENWLADSRGQKTASSYIVPG